MVERISTLLGSTGAADVDPAAQISQLCAQIISTTAALDKLRKEKEGASSSTLIVDEI